MPESLEKWDILPNENENENENENGESVGKNEKSLAIEEDEDDIALSKDNSGKFFEVTPLPPALKRAKKSNSGLKVKISKRVFSDKNENSSD